MSNNADDVQRINNGDAAEAVSGYTPTQLVNVNYTTTADFSTTPLEWTITQAQMQTYDYFVFRIVTENAGVGEGNDTYVFNGASFDAVPEPATVGMLGLGALLTLLVRRIRA